MDFLSLGTIGLLVGGLILIALVIIFFGKITNMWHKVPPNKVYVIYGRKSKAIKEDGTKEDVGFRLISGGGVWIWPLIEAYQELDLSIITISQPGDEVYTENGVPIRLDWVTQIQIASDDTSLRTAARAFLGKTNKEIEEKVRETLSTSFRAIVGQMTVEAVHNDRDTFVQKVQDLASDEMNLMGITVVSMGVKEITDDQGYFEAMAAKRIAEVKRDAKIANAEADREARVKAAEARQTAEMAEVEADRNILAEKEAFEKREIEKKKAVDLSQQEADLAVAEKQAEAEKLRQEATVLVPARANKEAAEINSEAEKIKLTVTAEAAAEAAETKAKGEANATKLNAEADAQAIRQKGDATASATKAELLAEAEGQFKLAEATAAEGSVNLQKMVVDALKEIEVAKATALADAIGKMGSNVKVVDLGGGQGANGEGSPLARTLMSIAPLMTMMNEQSKALSEGGEASMLEQVTNIVASLADAAKGTQNAEEEVPPAEEKPKPAKKKANDW